MSLRLDKFCLACAMVTAAFSMAVDVAGTGQSVSPDTPLSNVTFVAFDTETTGLAAKRERVVEIAALKFRAGRVLERQCWLINPGIPIPASVQKIHGISDAMVTNKPPIAAVLPQFTRFTEGCVLVAHNAKFDRRFVAAELKRNDLAAPSTPLIDSIPLFKIWFPAEPSYALSSLATRLLPPPTHLPSFTADDRTNHLHSAGWDAECLMALFLKGSTNLPAQGTLTDLLRLTDGAYSFGSAQRHWKPTAAQSSAGASPVSSAP